MKKSVLQIVVLGATLIAAVAPAVAVNWPQWRGPEGNGVAPEGRPPVTFSESENLSWKVEIPGYGHASPVVWEDKVFILTAVETVERPPDEPPAEGEQRRRRMIVPAGPVRFVVLALDRATGDTLWERTAIEAVPHEGTHPDGTWASASAVTDGEVLLAQFGSRGLFAYDLEGNGLWSVDLGDMQTRNGFGEGSSPALWGDSVVVTWDHEGDSFIVVLDRDTGTERWRRMRDEPTSWSTPVVIEVNGSPQVIASATERVRGYDLQSGDVVWEASGMTLNTIPTPAYSDGVLYAMSGFRGNNLLAIELAEAKGDITGSASIRWSYDRDTPYVPSPLLYDGVLYMLKGNSGILTAFDAAAGDVLYGPERLPGVEGVYASPVGAAGRVYVAGRDGTVVVLAAGSEMRVLAENTLDEGFDASPAIAGDELFLRGRTHLYRFAPAGT